MRTSLPRLASHLSFFGTHSIRKGAATHVATGSTACLPISSICLRANWAMPGVLNRYIKYEAAGDQFVGKCVSDRKRTSTKFAASPAYFDFSALDSKERISSICLHTNWAMPGVLNRYIKYEAAGY